MKRLHNKHLITIRQKQQKTKELKVCSFLIETIIFKLLKTFRSQLKYPTIGLRITTFSIEGQ